MVKNKIKIYAMAMSAFAGVALMSCTNDLKAPVPGGATNLTSPVPTPDVVAWSGKQELANTFTGNTYSTKASTAATPATRGTYMNANMYNQDWDCIPNVDLTADELEELIGLFSKGEPTENDVILPFENYWVQQVYKGKDTYTPTDVNGNPVNGSNITGSNQMDKLVAYNENYSDTWWNPDSDLGEWGANEITHYEHINNFNNGNNTNNPGQCGCGIVHKGTTLMVDMSTEGITPNNQFGFHESFGTSHYYNNYIIIQYKGEWYVGFDYEMHKKEAQNGNEAKDVNRDWNFTDWIVKITPAYHKGKTPEARDKCKHCGHSIDRLEGGKWVHTSSQDAKCNEGDCAAGVGDNVCNYPEPTSGDQQVGDGDDNGDNGDNGGNGGNGNTGNPGSGTDKYKTNHVEINFALQDVHKLPNNSNKYDIEDLVTKLSIHVRYPKDVEVIIPVPADIYCDQDDLLILKDHYEGNYVYGGESNEINMVIGDNNVTLTVEFVTEKYDNLTATGKGYIRVRTEGINDEVINYCRENFGDGINFEIYNYYSMSSDSKTDFGYDELQWKYLSRSFVNFDWQSDIDDKIYPDFYVNAFNSLKGDYNRGDCYVWIMGDERANNGLTNGFYDSSKWSTNNQYSEFHNAYQGYHYNGSPYNWIYMLKTGGSEDPSVNAMETGTDWPFATSPSQQLGQ